MTASLVDLDEARTLLRVDAQADQKAVKRAYLRAVKRHKPERDPEGFQRVREAFDVAKRFAPMMAVPSTDQGAAASSPPSEQTVTPTPLTPALDEPLDLLLDEGPAGEFDEELAEDRFQRLMTLEDRLAGAAAEARIEAVGEALESDPGHLALREWLFEDLTWQERFEEAEALLPDVPPSARNWFETTLEQAKNPTPYLRLQRELQHADPETSIAALREAVATDPEDAGLWHWLLSLMLDSGEKEAARELAEDAPEMTRRGLRTTLAMRAPELFESDELRALGTENPDAVIPLLVERGDIEGATSLIGLEIGRVEEGEHAYYAGLLHHIVRLARAGEGAAAQELVDRFRAAMRTQGLGSQLGQHGALTLLLFTELLDVWDDLPHQVWELGLRGIDQGDFEGELDELRAWSKKHPGPSRRARAHLVDHAPNLFAVLADGLESGQGGRRQQSGYEPPARSRPQNWMIAMFAIFALTTSLRMARSCGRSTHQPIPADISRQLQDMAPALEDRAATSALRTALDAGDCERAHALEPEAREALARLARSENGALILYSTLSELLQRLERDCPPLFSSPESP